MCPHERSSPYLSTSSEPNQIALATSQKVRNHLPARVMRAASDENGAGDGNNKGSWGGGGIPTNIFLGNDDGAASSAVEQSPNATQTMRKKPQMPMEHDGGVLCLCAVSPPPETNNDNRSNNEYSGGPSHRFLSGGTDGTMKLWSVPEPSTRNSANAKLAPRLIRTYAGHSGYVHCIAVLGTLSDNT